MSRADTLPTGAGSGSLIFTCPDWCRHAGDLDAHDDTEVTDVDADGRFTVTTEHLGPAWGPFTAVGVVDSVTVKCDVSIFIDTAALRRLEGACDREAALREHAADLLAASDWLDANR